MKDMNAILITNIQRFSLHDGPGIRTTLFLKGCSLRCPWCCNPENLFPQPQDYKKDGVSGKYGKYLFSDEIVKECLKDNSFYGGKLQSPNQWNITASDQIQQLPGGVTFSGGESLLQMKALVPVCKALHEKAVHLAVETCLFCPASDVKLAIEHIDLFYVDMKILDPKRCESVEHGNLALYLDNLDMIMRSAKPVVIRIPVIGQRTDDEENRRLVHELIKKSKDDGGIILKIELMKEHNLGENKYKSLNMHQDYHGVEDSLMEQYKEEMLDIGIPVEVCKI